MLSVILVLLVSELSDNNYKYHFYNYQIVILSNTVMKKNAVRPATDILVRAPQSFEYTYYLPLSVCYSDWGAFNFKITTQRA